VDTPAINGPSYRYWQLTFPVITNLYRLGRTLLSDQPDDNASYLVDKNAFFTAKALNIAIPGGSKFEPLYCDMDVFDEDWNKFNDANKVIIRQQIYTKYKVAFSHLYNSLLRSVHLSPYHAPKNVDIRTDDPDLPAFYFNPIINPIVIIRQQIRTKYKVASPHLYNSLPRSIHPSLYHAPKNIYICTDDPDLPTFYFDPL